jgi:hypothetical protein
VTRTRTILVWGALAAIAIAASLTLRALLVDSAESYLKTLGDNTVSLRGTRMPCIGYFDVGFTVNYRRTRVDTSFVGRICRPIMSPDWVFYPDRNEVTR